MLIGYISWWHSQKMAVGVAVAHGDEMPMRAAHVGAAARTKGAGSADRCHSSDTSYTFFPYRFLSSEFVHTSGFLFGMSVCHRGACAVVSHGAQGASVAPYIRTFSQYSKYIVMYPALASSAVCDYRQVGWRA